MLVRVTNLWKIAVDQEDRKLKSQPGWERLKELKDEKIIDDPDNNNKADKNESSNKSMMQLINKIDKFESVLSKAHNLSEIDSSDLYEFLKYNETMRLECGDIFKLLTCCNVLNIDNKVNNDEIREYDEKENEKITIAEFNGLSMKLDTNIVECKDQSERYTYRVCVDSGLLVIYDALRNGTKHINVKEIIWLDNEGILNTGVSIIEPVLSQSNTNEEETRPHKREPELIPIEKNITVSQQLTACIEHSMKPHQKPFELCCVSFDCNLKDPAPHLFAYRQCWNIINAGFGKSTADDPSHIICYYFNLNHTKCVVCLALCIDSQGTQLKQLDQYCMKRGDCRLHTKELILFDENNRLTHPPSKDLISLADLYDKCENMLTSTSGFHWWKDNKKHLQQNMNPFYIKNINEIDDIVKTLPQFDKNCPCGIMARRYINTIENCKNFVADFNIVCDNYTYQDQWATMLNSFVNNKVSLDIALEGQDLLMKQMKFMIFASIIAQLVNNNLLWRSVLCQQSGRYEPTLKWYELNQKHFFRKIRYDSRIFKYAGDLCKILLWFKGWDPPKIIEHSPKRYKQKKKEFCDYSFDVNKNIENGWKIFGIYHEQSKIHKEYEHKAHIEQLLQEGAQMAKHKGLTLKNVVVLHLFKIDKNGLRSRFKIEI